MPKQWDITWFIRRSFTWSSTSYIRYIGGKVGGVGGYRSQQPCPDSVSMFVCSKLLIRIQGGGDNNYPTSETIESSFEIYKRVEDREHHPAPKRVRFKPPLVSPTTDLRQGYKHPEDSPRINQPDHQYDNLENKLITLF